MEEILLTKLDEIFYKKNDCYTNIFMSGNNKFYKIKLFGLTKEMVEREIKRIDLNKNNKIIKEKMIDIKTYHYIYFENKGKRECLFSLEERLNEYCKEISKIEYIKELI